MWMFDFFCQVFFYYYYYSQWTATQVLRWRWTFCSERWKWMFSVFLQCWRWMMFDESSFLLHLINYVALKRKPNKEFEILWSYFAAQSLIISLQWWQQQIFCQQPALWLDLLWVFCWWSLGFYRGHLSVFSFFFSTSFSLSICGFGSSQTNEKCKIISSE